MRGSGLGNNPRLPIRGIYLLNSVFKEKNSGLFSTWIKKFKENWDKEYCSAPGWVLPGCKKAAMSSWALRNEAGVSDQNGQYGAGW